MVLPNECVQTGASSKCLGCQKQLKPAARRTGGGGWAIWYWCSSCGPHTRESGYYKNEVEARAALDSGNYRRE